MKNLNKVLHFDQDFSIKEIISYLSNNDEIFYFTRLLKEGKEFHLIKHNENAFFKINSLISQLFKYYDSKKETKFLIKGTNIKGNEKFIIIENVNSHLSHRIKSDLNNLLKK